MIIPCLTTLPDTKPQQFRESYNLCIHMFALILEGGVIGYGYNIFS
jgi:hypothetical protein